VLDDDQAGGTVIELLADLRADALPLATAIGAGALVRRNVVQDRAAWQVGRERPAAVALAFGLFRGSGWRRRRVRGGSWLGLGRRGRVELGEDVRGEQQELVRVDLFAGSAEPLAEQPFELVLHVADEESLLVESFQQLSDQAVAGVQVGGELDGQVLHTYEYVTQCYSV